jgi:hypothetical protein
MSEENVEIVLESLRRAEANDVEGSAALMHPDISATAVLAGARRGKRNRDSEALASIRAATAA